MTEKTEKKTTRKYIKRDLSQERLERFIKAWQAADDVDSAAAAMGIEKKEAYVLRAYLAKVGVTLKKMKHGKRPGAARLDVAALQAAAGQQ